MWLNMSNLRRMSRDRPMNFADEDTTGDSTVEPLRLVILGKTGVGKSCVGNIILRRNAFVSKPSGTSVTQVCEKAEVTEGGRQIEVIDTPGVLDTSRRPQVVAKEILNCIQVSSPGPHAFLLVLQATRFTEDEQNTVRALQRIFGEKVTEYMIIIFNRADDLGNQTIQDYVKDCNDDLRKVIKECGGRYVPFSKDLDNREQVANLVRKVDDLIVVNGGKPFSNEYYEASFLYQMLSRMIQLVSGMWG